jgi:tRNA G18 (ribose-2'-O)-methylase SpoU
MKNKVGGQKKDIRVILHNIRSAFNVGSIFRTSDAFGVSSIYISGYTPAPIDKFGRQRKEIAKTALGGEFSVKWQKADVFKTIEQLKKEGFEVLAIEQDSKSIDYRKIKSKGKVVFLVGNEVKGLSKQILAKCDKILEIEMKGIKESLNVSVAYGIVLSALI